MKQKSIDTNSKNMTGEFSNLKLEIYNQLNRSVSKEGMEDSRNLICRDELILHQNQNDTMRNSQNRTSKPLKSKLEAPIVHSNEKKLNRLISTQLNYPQANKNLIMNLQKSNINKKSSS